MKTKTADRLWMLGFCALALALVLGTAFAQSFIEARAYNNATGSNVSTWDAMFINLRVQGSPK